MVRRVYNGLIGLVSRARGISIRVRVKARPVRIRKPVVLVLWLLLMLKLASIVVSSIFRNHVDGAVRNRGRVHPVLVREHGVLRMDMVIMVIIDWGVRACERLVVGLHGNVIWDRRRTSA